MIKEVLKKNKYYLIIFILITISLTIIMKSPLYSSILSFDEKIIDYISNIRTKNLNIFFRIITEFGYIYIPSSIIVIFFIISKKRIKPITLLCSTIILGLFSFLSKYLVLRARPINAIIKLPNTTSFPSGHSMSSLVFYLTLSYIITYNKPKKVRIIYYLLSIILSLFVGFSRIYLGVHYFSDVIGGYIYGIVLFILIKEIINEVFKLKRVI